LPLTILILCEAFIMSLLRTITVLMAIAPVALASGEAAAADYAPPAPVTPHLRSYPQWAALWQQWAVGTPADRNPVLDRTGANCAVNQPVPGVFFLAGTFDGSAVTRSCTVPVGTAFVIPIFAASYFAVQTDSPEQRTEAFARAQVTCVENAPVLGLSIDGQSIATPPPQPPVTSLRIRPIT
jgi:hypothetical protein